MMTYLSRDSEGRMIPNPSLMTNIEMTQHLSPADWKDVFAEIGFVDDQDPYPKHNANLYPDRVHYKHDKDSNLRLSFDSSINLVTISTDTTEEIYIYPVDSNSLSYAIGLLLKAIRGLYETHC